MLIHYYCVYMALGKCGFFKCGPETYFRPFVSCLKNPTLKNLKTSTPTPVNTQEIFKVTRMKYSLHPVFFQRKC